MESKKINGEISAREMEQMFKEKKIAQQELAKENSYYSAEMMKFYAELGKKSFETKKLYSALGIKTDEDLKEMCKTVREIAEDRRKILNLYKELEDITDEKEKSKKEEFIEFKEYNLRKKIGDKNLEDILDFEVHIDVYEEIISMKEKNKSSTKLKEKKEESKEKAEPEKEEKAKPEKEEKAEPEKEEKAEPEKEEKAKSEKEEKAEPEKEEKEEPKKEEKEYKAKSKKEVINEQYERNMKRFEQLKNDINYRKKTEFDRIIYGTAKDKNVGTLHQNVLDLISKYTDKEKRRLSREVKKRNNMIKKIERCDREIKFIEKSLLMRVLGFNSNEIKADANKLVKQCIEITTEENIVFESKINLEKILKDIAETYKIQLNTPSKDMER